MPERQQSIRAVKDSDLTKTLFGVGCDDLVRPLRVPSEERGCKGKLQLGEKYRPQADRMSRMHGKAFGVYRCPHCDGTHLTTKLDKANEYEPLLYICGTNVESIHGGKDA